ncbi:MAG: hypothetical protein Q7J35_08375 [Candidatus Methanoperedens sp.]|nr:hypothetical protein [Candidatus Methanoperedens sp.]
MLSFDITEKRPCINIFKLNKAYYFKHFFDDPELFREMASAGARNKVMKYLDRKGFDPNIIEDAAPFTVEIGEFQKYGELLKNSIDSYPMLDKIVFVMKDLLCVEQAIVMGATMRSK